MHKVLVTGASGFIGGHLVEHLLEQGYSVRCLVRASSDTRRLSELGVELVVGDLVDKPSLCRAMAGVTTVYHLAGQIYQSASESFDAINAAGAENVLEAASRQANPPVVISVSSLAAAGPVRNGALPRETDQPRPVSRYGMSKAESERRLRLYAGRVPISIVRPPLVFGPGDPATFPMFKSIRRGIHATVSRNQPFSVVYVKDLARLMVTIAERGERLAPTDSGDGQGIYFGGFAQTLTWEELGQQIAAAMGRQRRPLLIRVPATALKLVGAMADKLAAVSKRELFISLDKAREGAAGGWACSVEKIQQQFGFEPQLSLEQALAETVVAYRQAGML